MSWFGMSGAAGLRTPLASAEPLAAGQGEHCASVTPQEALRIAGEAAAAEDLAAAEACLIQARARGAADRDLTFQLVRVLAFQGRHAAAAELFATTGGDDPERRELAGDLAWYAGRPAAAAAHYESAAGVTPTLALAVKWVRALRASGRHGDADALWRRHNDLWADVTEWRALTPGQAGDPGAAPAAMRTRRLILAAKRYLQSQDRVVDEAELRTALAAPAWSLALGARRVALRAGDIGLLDPHVDVEVAARPGAAPVILSAAYDRGLRPEFTWMSHAAAAVEASGSHAAPWAILMGGDRYAGAGSPSGLGHLGAVYRGPGPRLELRWLRGLVRSPTAAAEARLLAETGRFAVRVTAARGRDAASRPYLSGGEVAPYTALGGGLSYGVSSAFVIGLDGERRLETGYDHRMAGGRLEWRF